MTDLPRAPSPASAFPAALALAAAFSPAAGASSPALSLASYIQELDRWEAAVGAAAPAPGTTAGPPEPPASWTVDLDGQSIEVSTDWLGEGLRRLGAGTEARETIASDLAARIGDLRDSARSAASGSPAADAARLGETVATILSRREFRTVRADSWFQARLKRIMEWLAERLRLPDVDLSRHPVIGTALLWTLAAVLFSILALRLLRRAPARTSGAVPAGGAAVRTMTWRLWIEAARAAAASGDRREALRCLYWAAVHRLAEADLVALDPARTHREYLESLPRGHGLRGALGDLTRRFEEAWYGGRAATEEDLRAASARAREIGCESASIAGIGTS